MQPVKMIKKLQPLVNILQLEKLQKENELSAQKLNETIMALYEANNTILSNNEDLFTNYSYKSNYE